MEIITTVGAIVEAKEGADTMKASRCNGATADKMPAEEDAASRRRIES